jgi:hypothetical protein
MPEWTLYRGMQFGGGQRSLHLGQGRLGGGHNILRSRASLELLELRLSAPDSGLSSGQIGLAGTVYQAGLARLGLGQFGL